MLAVGTVRKKQACLWKAKRGFGNKSTASLRRKFFCLAVAVLGLGESTITWYHVLDFFEGSGKSVSGTGTRNTPNTERMTLRHRHESWLCSKMYYLRQELVVVILMIYFSLCNSRALGPASFSLSPSPLLRLPQGWYCLTHITTQLLSRIPSSSS